MNERQRRFAQEYVVDLNGTQAAIRAGYAPKNAHVTAAKLLRNPKVAQEVQAARRKRERATEIDAERVLREIGRIAFGDIRGIFDPETGELKHPSKWDDATAAAVSSVEVVSRRVPGSGQDGEDAEIEYVHKIKTVDKARGLEMLGKHLAMFVDRQQHEGAVSIDVIGTSDAFDDGEE